MKKWMASLLATLMLLTMLFGAWAEDENDLPNTVANGNEETDEYIPQEVPEEIEEFELGEEELGEDTLEIEYENTTSTEASEYADIEWGK